MLAPWLAEILIITVRDLSTAPRRLPLPSELLSTFVVFGALSVIASNETARRPATAIAWGLVLATGIVTYAPPSEGGFGVDLLKPVGDFLAPAGLNQQAANILQNSTAPAPTVGTGKGDTGNITAGLRPA